VIEDGLASKVTSAAAAGKEVGEKVAAGKVAPTLVDEVKSPAERGHEGGLIGGPKRDEVLTGAEKEKIARKGGYARWNEAKSERDE